MDISNIKLYDTVAFKTKENDWFTGTVGIITETSISINLNIPIEPTYYSSSDKTVYFLRDIIEIVVLESETNNNLLEFDDCSTETEHHCAERGING